MDILNQCKMSEPTYSDIERYKYRPRPTDVLELLDQAGQLTYLSREFPEYFPGDINDEELLRFLKKAEESRMRK